MAIKSHFHPRPSDLLLVTNPKSGTTWLKALSFATLHRHSFSLSDHPLLTTTPHDCVPFIETLFNHSTIPNLNTLPSPTIFATHSPLSLLPETLSADSSPGYRIVYLCREPKDTLVSLWNFNDGIRTSVISGEETEGLEFSKAFDMFSQDKFLFLRYEEIMEDPVSQLRKLAEFMGCPFSMDEERDGVVEHIVELCSFGNLSKLDVNKTTPVEKDILPPSSFFRKGRVGDWVNYLSMEMDEKLDLITKEKLHGSGLIFKCTTTGIAVDSSSSSSMHAAAASQV
ncbi:hypothetical protein J5N97_013183 [Dioscorea zingiberensis]|uniref:Sulfotransferase n=1 Tax=Dioscorea zingiberensis TaxID=325984 RepID=A0A9D5CRD8_9LILI|nr:hypothetical protein J5N97_013183 [Dioscorea zingiberensis]